MFDPNDTTMATPVATPSTGVTPTAAPPMTPPMPMPATTAALPGSALTGSSLTGGDANTNPMFANKSTTTSVLGASPGEARSLEGASQDVTSVAGKEPDYGKIAGQITGGYRDSMQHAQQQSAAAANQNFSVIFGHQATPSGLGTRGPDFAGQIGVQAPGSPSAVPAIGGGVLTSDRRAKQNIQSGFKQTQQFLNQLYGTLKRNQ